MATIRRVVLDLSHHNTVTDWDEMVSAGIQGMIHKASEGDYMTDDKYPGRRSGCAESGLCWGAYHFATNDPVDAQVDLFLRAAQPDADTMLVLDWEDYGSKQMTKSQARDWIEKVEAATGRPGEVVIYSGNTAKEQLNSSDTFFGERRLWLAQYSSNPTPGAPWDTIWLHQYSDGNSGPEPKGCPGVSGDVDTNSYSGSNAQLRAEWASGIAEPQPEPEPEPEPTPDEITITITVEAPPGVNVIVNQEQVTPPPVSQTRRRKKFSHRSG